MLPDDHKTACLFCLQRLHRDILLEICVKWKHHCHYQTHSHIQYCIVSFFPLNNQELSKT